MSKEKLIPFIIRNCDERTFRDMWWHDDQGVVCFDWTRQGNAGWQPPEVASEWARQKSNLRDKQPRDLKAGLRNALDKKKELIKCKFSKEIEERDGRKYKFWKFIDLESERRNIINPPSKNAQKKKTINQKDLQSHQYVEDNQPQCNSTSDSKDRYQRSQKTLAKAKSLGKRGGRRKLPYVKHIDNVEKQHPKQLQKVEQENSCSLPSISSFFEGKVQRSSPPPLQSQTISSTYNENWFPYTSESEPSTSQPITLFPSGPTPPPQPNDVELPGESFKFVSPHSSTQQLFTSQYTNYTCSIGFPEDRTAAQNFYQQPFQNSIDVPTIQQSHFTTTISYLNSNFQDMDECYSSVQQNELCIPDILTDKTLGTEVTQLQEETINSEFPTNLTDSQLFDFLNALQFDDSITDVSC